MWMSSQREDRKMDSDKTEHTEDSLLSDWADGQISSD